MPFFRRIVCVSIMIMLSTMCISGQIPYKSGDRLAQFGAGYGLYGVDGDISTPPLTLGLQFFTGSELSIGALLAFSSTNFTSQSVYWNNGGFSKINGTYSYYVTGLRAEYHFTEDTVNYDVYAGCTAGYSFVSFSQPANIYSNSGFNALKSYGILGIHGGIRYYVKPNFAFLSEIGYGIGYFSIGVSYKWD